MHIDQLNHCCEQSVRAQVAQTHGVCITDMRYCFGRTKWVIVSKHDRLILPPRVSHQNSEFASSCLLSERDM